MNSWLVRVWLGDRMVTPARGLSRDEALRCARHLLSPAASLFGARADAALIADTNSSRLEFVAKE